MEKELHNIFSILENEIHLFQNELQKREHKKKMLQQQALYHLTTICPNQLERLFGKNPSLCKPGEDYLEKMFFDKNCIEEILGYAVKNLRFSFEGTRDIYKIWLIEGQVGEFSFIVELLTTLNEETGKEESLYVQKVELFPQSESLEEFARALKDLNSIKLLVPNLCLLQNLVMERSAVEEYLESYVEVETNEESDALLITVKVDSSMDVKIKWQLSFSNKSLAYLNDISVEADDDLQERYEGHRCHPLLTQEESLKSAEEVSQFIFNLFSD